MTALVPPPDAAEGDSEPEDEEVLDHEVVSANGMVGQALFLLPGAEPWRSELFAAELRDVKGYLEFKDISADTATYQCIVELLSYNALWMSDHRSRIVALVISPEFPGAEYWQCTYQVNIKHSLSKMPSFQTRRGRKPLPEAGHRDYNEIDVYIIQLLIAPEVPGLGSFVSLP